MVVRYDSKYNSHGYGLTAWEADESLRMNTLRLKKNESNPRIAWLPLPNLLQVKDVCTVIYEDGYLINNKTGKTVYVVPQYLGHFKYLFYVLDGLVSYEDFTTKMCQTVDTFLANISAKFGSISEFPEIKPETSIITTVSGTVTDIGDQIYYSPSYIIYFSNKHLTLRSTTMCDQYPTDSIITYLMAESDVLCNGKDVKLL